jgi:hypothetical protein
LQQVFGGKAHESWLEAALVAALAGHDTLARCLFAAEGV